MRWEEEAKQQSGLVVLPLTLELSDNTKVVHTLIRTPVIGTALT